MSYRRPLWKIGDATEQTLMNRFYKELSTGKSRTEALRQAQLQLLRSAPTHSVLAWGPSSSRVTRSLCLTNFLRAERRENRNPFTSNARAE
jgi:CHAT domain-containing protein